MPKRQSARMSFTTTEVNALIYKYLVEAGDNAHVDCFTTARSEYQGFVLAGFTHSAYCFNNESQSTKSYSEMAQIAPGSLIRFLQKGLVYAEIEANLKEVCYTGQASAQRVHCKSHSDSPLVLQDKSTVGEVYKLVNASELITMDDKEAKEHVQAMRAEDEESSDEEPPAAPQQTRPAPEAKLSKAKRGRKAVNGVQHSDVRQNATAQQPAQPSRQTAEESEQAQPSSDRSQQQAAEMQDAQPAKPAKVPQPPRAQVTVLDTQNREMRLCMWSPTEAVLASG